MSESQMRQTTSNTEHGDLIERIADAVRPCLGNAEDLARLVLGVIGKTHVLAPLETAAPLIEMGRRLAADLQRNEHFTRDPIFTVQKRRRVYGLDPAFTERIAWLHDGSEVAADEAERLEAAYDEAQEVPPDYTRTGYADEWEHFASYITPQAAEEFAKDKGDGCRVYVDSGCRNNEWQAVRAHLLALAGWLEPAVGRRYVLHPGYVISKTDGDRHYINAARLAHLYGLRLADCIVMHDDEAGVRGYRQQPGDVHLYPRSNGDYRLPPNAKDQP